MFDVNPCVPLAGHIFTSCSLCSHVRSRLDVIKELSVAMKAGWPSSTYIITNSFTSAGGGDGKKKSSERDLPSSCAPPAWRRMSLFSPSWKNLLMWSQFGTGAHWEPSCGDNMSCICESLNAKESRRAGEDRPTKWEALWAVTTENTSGSSSSASINAPQYFCCLWGVAKKQKKKNRKIKNP